jgi:hypothetical protein
MEILNIKNLSKIYGKGDTEVKALLQSLVNRALERVHF